MDEQKISDVFRDAVRDVPPASFTQSDVAAASHRATIRRRNGIVAASAFGVALLAGGVVVGTTVWGDGSNGSGDSAAVAAAPSVTTSNKFSPRGENSGKPPGQTRAVPEGLPQSSPKQGGDGSGTAGPSAGSTLSGCDQAADGELAAALAGELPSVAGSQPLRADISCPLGSRSVALAVGDDGTGARGTVSVVVTRPGTALGAPPWEGALSPGSTTAQARTHSGGNVFIASEPMKGTNRAPFAGQVTAVAQRLGAKL